MSQKLKRKTTSMFIDKGVKKTEFKLAGDSANMTFAACLKSEFNGGIDMSQESISQVFQNALYINLLQVCIIFMFWNFAFYDENFQWKLPYTLNLLAARFIASMMMHLNVEKDIRNGLTMMKYAVNHW